MIFKNFVHVLKRFKTSSILNILGLSAAFTVFVGLAVQVYYDLSFDRNFKNAEEIYLMSFYSPFTDKHACWVNTQTGDKMISKVPQVESYTTTTGSWTMRLYAENTNPETSIEERMMKVRGDFISVFNPKVLEGNLAEAIAEGNNLAISESTAQKLFGTESAMGKTLVNYYNKNAYTVKAVLEDFPKNCSFQNGVFLYLAEDSPQEGSYNLYMKIKSENVSQFEKYLNSDDFFGEGSLQAMEEHPEQKTITSVVPFTDIHLKYPTKGSGDFSTTMALMAIAILTLVIAYINFINFSMATAPSRVKALTIQRVLGMSKEHQTWIIAIESGILSFIAFCIGLLSVNFLSASALAELFSADLAIVKSPGLICIGGLIAFFIGLVIGIYPARYITRFDVIDALKGTSSGGGRTGTKLRSSLIVFQFVAAISPIIITLFIKLQHDYMVNYSWGIQKENIVYINTENKGIDKKTLCEELIKDTRIIDYTASRFTPGNVQMGWDRFWEGKRISIKSWPVSDNYLQFFGAEVIAGDDFTTLNNPDRVKLIFNEEFLRKYDLKAEDVIGKEFPAFETPAQVVGVVKDINFESLKMPIYPMAFVTLGERGAIHIVFLKLSGNDTKGALKWIEDTWRQHSNETLEIKFLDKQLEQLYSNENNLGKLVGLFGIITILIAIMGIYGLIIFTTRYRKKEIALRKVNGANEMQIMQILNREMILQLLIGFVIASPISYFIVDKWLSRFAYHIEIQWWVFIVSGLLVALIALVSVTWQSYKAAIDNPTNSLKSE